MFVNGGCKERRGEDVATNRGEKLENAKENEETSLGGKKRKKNRKNKKGVQKLTCVNGEPAGGGENRDAEKRTNVTSHLASDSEDETPKPRKKLKKMKEDEPDNMNNTPAPGQGERIEGEMTPASKEGTEVTAANNEEPKRERKRRNKIVKADEAGGSAQDIVEGDCRPAKKIKTESMEEEVEEKREVPAAEVSLENSKPALTRYQKRKEWFRKVRQAVKESKRKAKQRIGALNENMVSAQSQNASTTIAEEPGTENKDSGKRRDLDDAYGTLVNVSDNKQDNGMKNNYAATQKTKQENADGNCDSQKEATTGVYTEGPVRKKKKKKRRRKKQTPVATEDTTSEKEMKPKTTKPKKKRCRRGRRWIYPRCKYFKEQDGIQTSLPNTSGNEPSDTHTAQAQLEVTTAPIDSTRDSGMQLPILHPSCASQKNKERIAECWKGSREELEVEKDSVVVFKYPFNCCYILHLLQDEAYLDGVKKELDNIELLSKNNDLYKFRQTGDLRGVTSPFIAHLRNLLCTEIRQWLIDVTGIPLSDVVDMGSSRYSHTDMLLCHDDELEGRRIAYILYLVPPWRPWDGGSLDLFTTDGDGHPLDIVKSLIPQNNAFAFFEVSPVSFHQVSEVRSRDKTRLSINGWFHGPPVPRPKRSPPPCSPLQGPTHLEAEDFYSWINPMYLDMNIQKLIRRKFCSESELELENFLTDEAYKRLSGALKNKSLPWKRTGPADRQSYKVLSPDSMPQDAKECQQFLGCEALFLVLSQLTGLKLHPWMPQDSDDDDEEDSAVLNPQCHVEAQSWGPGCYTLIRDDCVDGRAALDAFLYANVSQQWTQELGGHVTYIAKDEDEELLTVVPQSNCLCLVYRDAETLRFTKYITGAARDLGVGNSHFQSFACTYYE